MRQKKKSRRQNVAARQNKKRGIAPFFFYGIDNRVYISVCDHFGAVLFLFVELPRGAKLQAYK